MEARGDSPYTRRLSSLPPASSSRRTASAIAWSIAGAVLREVAILGAPLPSLVGTIGIVLVVLGILLYARLR